MSELDEIALEFQTDKSSKGHNYLGIYEEHLAHLRDEEFVLVEIGVLRGGSLKTWRRYFPKATIVGVDVKPPQDFGEEVTVLQGDQGDVGFLTDLGARYRPTLIIDDGSHCWGHQMITFEHLFPFLQPGGIYICEDLHTSFGELSSKYSNGYATRPSDFFTNVAAHVLGGSADVVPQRSDPLMHYLKERVRTMTFLRHSLIIRTNEAPDAPPAA